MIFSADECDRVVDVLLGTDSDAMKIQRVKDILGIRDGVRPPPRCTGVAARWCPIHGDCECEHDSETDYNDEECPLHSPASKHAESESAG